MKIIQVISYFFPAWSYGGPGKLVYELSKSLVCQGNEVVVFSTDAFDGKRRRIKNDNMDLPGNGTVRHYFFSNISNTLAYKLKVFVPFIDPFTLIREIRNTRVIHIHEFFTPLAITCIFLARILKKPVILSAHGTLDAYHLQNRGLMKNIFMFIFGNFMLGEVSLFIAATGEEKEEYRQLGIKENIIRIVKNGIDLSDYEHKIPKNKFRSRFQISASEKVLLYLGRISPLKGLDTLIRAFSTIGEKQGTKLVIAGSDDGAQEDLESLTETLKIRDKVIFPGVLYGKEKMEAYADADIFVYPSPSEGFSIAILEAGASGLPLLITRGCKFAEVEEYNAGVIVDHTADNFEKAIINLLNNDKDRLIKGRNIQILVKEKYGICLMAKKLSEEYCALNK